MPLRSCFGKWMPVFSRSRSILNRSGALSLSAVAGTKGLASASQTVAMAQGLIGASRQNIQLMLARSLETVSNWSKELHDNPDEVPPLESSANVFLWQRFMCSNGQLLDAIYAGTTTDS